MPRSSGEYFTAVKLPYLGQPVFGLHRITPPSAAANMGVATATYVQTKPTIRINILTARFMDFLLECGSPGSGNPHGHGLYREDCRSPVLVFLKSQEFSVRLGRNRPKTAFYSIFSTKFELFSVRESGWRWCPKSRHSAQDFDGRLWMRSRGSRRSGTDDIRETSCPSSSTTGSL